MARRHQWPILRKEGTITTSSGTEKYSLASDFDEHALFTFWDQTNRWPLELVDYQEWQTLQSSGLTSSPRTYYFFEQGASNDLAVSLFPVPTSTRTISYYYLSNKLCKSSGGTGQTTWAADDDTGIIDERLTALDLKWRFKQAKGLPYAEDLRDFETALSRAMSSSGDAKIVSLALRRVYRDNIPETGINL